MRYEKIDNEQIELKHWGFCNPQKPERAGGQSNNSKNKQLELFMQLACAVGLNSNSLQCHETQFQLFQSSSWSRNRKRLVI